MAVPLVTDQTVQACLDLFNARYNTAITQLKPLQVQALKSIISGDTICMLPTGFGKSLVYEMLPDLCLTVFKTKSFLIIIVPLNVILDQVTGKLGDAAVALTEDKLKELEQPDSPFANRILSGNVFFLVSHPENIVHKKSVCTMLSHRYFSEVKTFLVIDEAHCVLEWGDTFRPLFRELVKLRALLPTAKVLALSATLTADSRNKLAKIMGMQTFQTVMCPPARDNISLIVCHRPKSHPDSLDAITHPLFHQLKREGQNFPFTVLYFANTSWQGIAYEAAAGILGEAMHCGEAKLENARVVQYHSSIDSSSNESSVKSTILRNLAKDPAESPLRLVLATVALGMGVDLRNVHRVITIAPKELESYVQQVGRAGRDGSQAIGVLYYNNTDLAQPVCTSTMKEFCQNTARCRREILNFHFGFHSSTQAAVSANTCCDVCCKDLSAPFQVQAENLKAKAEHDALKTAISEYIQNDSTGYLATKLTVSVIEQILCSPYTYRDAHKLQEHFAIDKWAVAQSLSNIISAAKSDSS